MVDGGGFPNGLSLDGTRVGNLWRGNQGHCYRLRATAKWPRIRNVLPPRLWRAFRAIAMEYIALVFAADFILSPLQGSGAVKHPLTYIPFALMLVGGVVVRIAAVATR